MAEVKARTLGSVKGWIHVRDPVYFLGVLMRFLIFMQKGSFVSSQGNVGQERLTSAERV